MSGFRLAGPSGGASSWRALVALALVAPALAGCLGAAVEPPARAAATSSVFRYVCPGAAGEGAAEPCLANLPRADATNYQQPYVAVHPTDPRIIAVGATLANPDGERVRHFAAGDRVETTLGIYVTEDGGATWHETVAPPPANADPLVTMSEGEAALLFDPEGRLHVVGVARTERVGEPDDTNGLQHLRAYYVRSDDLGRTWTGAAWLDDDRRGADRPWIVRDPETGALYVAWQESWGVQFDNRTSVVAWSLDRGDTWSHLDIEERPTCFRGGMPVALQGLLRFPCVKNVEGQEPAVQIYAFDPATRRPMLIAEVDAEAEFPPEFPFMTLLADGALVINYDRQTPEGRESMLLHSADGGMTWEPSGGVRAWADETWDIHARISFSAADGFGNQHLLVRYDRFEPLLPRGETDRVVSRVESEVRHVVLDRSGAAVHNVVLERWHTDNLPDDVEQALVMGEWHPHEHPRCGACNDGLAWAGDRALFAFGAQDVVRLAFVEGTGAAAGPTRFDWPPVRPYVPPPPPPPPRGLDAPVSYEFTGHVNVPGCYVEPDPNSPESLRDSMTFEFEVPPSTRYVNGTLDWTTHGPAASPTDLDDLDVRFYDAQGDEFRGEDSVPEVFAFELRDGDQGLWTAVVTNCENPPTDFTLDLVLE